MNFFDEMWNDGYVPVVGDNTPINFNTLMADIESIDEYPCPKCGSKQVYDGWYNDRIGSYLVFAVCQGCGKRTSC